MSINLIFHISDFHNLKIVSFSSLLGWGLIFWSMGIYIYIRYILSVNKLIWDNIFKQATAHCVHG